MHAPSVCIPDDKKREQHRILPRPSSPSMSGQMECMGCQSERCFSRKSRKPSGNCSRSMLSKLIRVTHRRSQEIIEKTKCFPDYFLARISQKESPDQLTSKHGSVFDYSATFPIPFISNATCTPSARKARIIEASVMLFPLSKRQT